MTHTQKIICAAFALSSLCLDWSAQPTSAQGASCLNVDADDDDDGIPDSREANLGGDPCHKDIFVECDYMELDLNGNGKATDPGEHSHKLKPAAVEIIIAMFAAAPVSNPDGRTGITLHLDQGLLNGSLGKGNAIPEQQFLDFTSRKEQKNFFDIKAGNFDFASRAPYFHYCILAHNSGEEFGSASGQAEVDGNDLVVTLGSWPDENGNPLGTVKDQAGTFLHELGHNLGLDHGGGELLPVDEQVKNHKPNYVSVMNYSFQVVGINSRFDFSRIALPSLTETKLDEPVGVQNNPDGTRYFCRRGRNFVRDSVDGMNWNCVNGIEASLVKENINLDRTALGDPLLDTLRGHDDWSHLHLTFQTSPLYDAGAGAGFEQHRTNLGSYRPANTTSGRGTDREPEVTWPEGRCLEFVSLQKSDTSFTVVVLPQPDANQNNIGDACE